MANFEATERTTLRRRPDRGRYDAETVSAIIDATSVCHVGVVLDDGPLTIPMTHARAGDVLYLHGSQESRLLRALCDASRVCVAFTILDGLVLARTALHHSMNYRSAIIFGRASAVDDPAEKRQALEALIEHVAPGRWREIPPPTEQDIDATAVVAIAIEEASSKIREGGANDGTGCADSNVWAGVIPLATRALTPIAEPDLAENADLPASVLAILQGHS